jgi:hypothetical protein
LQPSFASSEQVLIEASEIGITAQGNQGGHVESTTQMTTATPTNPRPLLDRFPRLEEPQIMNQLQAVALNEGLRYKRRLWRDAGREQLESFRLARWAKWCSVPSARTSTPKECLTAPTLLERRFFAN